MTRWDRFLSLYGIRPLARALRQGKTSRLCILMYHSVSDSPEPEREPYYRLCTSPERLEEQLRFLRENDYKDCSLARTVEGPLPERAKYVCITFDDGYQDFYTHAFPILRRYDYTATVFLPVHFLLRQGLGLSNREHLSWEQVRELAEHGIVFGSHTLTHRPLAELSYGEIEAELSHSKRIIEEQTGVPVTAFSYPYAFPAAKEALVEFLKECLIRVGYTCGVTTTIGTVRTVPEPFLLPRLPVNSDDDLALFQAKLEGHYDWLGAVQYSVKWIKENLLPWS